MTKKEAKRKAWSKAASWLQCLLDAGWPYEMMDNKEPDESETELMMMLSAMEDVIVYCDKRGDF